MFTDRVLKEKAECPGPSKPFRLAPLGRMGRGAAREDGAAADEAEAISAKRTENNLDSWLSL